jgi:hypothetical protein
LRTAFGSLLFPSQAQLPSTSNFLMPAQTCFSLLLVLLPSASTFLLPRPPCFPILFLGWLPPPFLLLQLAARCLFLASLFRLRCSLSTPDLCLLAFALPFRQFLVLAFSHPTGSWLPHRVEA